MIRKCLMLLCLATLLASCATYNKKLRKSSEFFNAHPEELSKLCSDKFPVKTVFLPGKRDTVPGQTIYLPGDSIPCPDGSKVKAPDRHVKCPPSVNCTPDTIKVEDTAKIFFLNSQLKKAGDSLNVQKGKMSEKDKQLAEEKKGSKKKDWIIISLVLMIGVSIFLKIKGWI